MDGALCHPPGTHWHRHAHAGHAQAFLWMVNDLLDFMFPYTLSQVMQIPTLLNVGWLASF